MNRNWNNVVSLAFLMAACWCGWEPPAQGQILQARLDKAQSVVEIFRGKADANPVLTQQAQAGFRPYIHPIVAPDGKGTLTQFSPGHHKHQTGLYWGFTRVNGRDFFHHPEASHWKRISVEVIKEESFDSGDQVQWKTVYDMLDADGQPIMRETQTWSMMQRGEKYFLDLVWMGQAKHDVTIKKYDYGGLFLRMPWKPGTHGHAFNSARQRDARAEGQRAVWLDVGMEIAGRDDDGHITLFDHPQNRNFPNAWRVDGQLGVGPASARLGDIKIKRGKTLTYRHRLVIHTGELNDAEMTQLWSEYSGQGMAWAQWKLAQKEGREARFLSPQQAVSAMTVTDGFEVNVYGSEPMMTQPMAFCWDDRGRLWIAENRDYESRGAGFSNGGDSKILILEDTDHDGVLDKRKVFLEGIPFPAGIAVGMGGLWLGAPPNLLFVPDADQDDRADRDDIEVRLTGWGIRDRHETLNSFHWGPDGWLYGCQGFATPSRVGKPKGNGKLFKHLDPFPEDIEFAEPPTDINGGVWRYHPTRKEFEVVAHGFSNPWGIDYDSKGQMFITACVIPHLWHVIPGGIYHRQGGQHFNPYVYSDIRTIANHRHRSAHGGARVYQSDAFPEAYKGRIFMANIHEHAVLTDQLVPEGSGYSGHHGDDFLLANNAQWIGFSMEIGPDGGVYVLDWHDADICGKEVLNKDTGRVFRIMPKRSLADDWEGRYGDLRKLNDLALAKLQLSPSDWHARRARILLQERSSARPIDQAAIAELNTIFDTNGNADLRLKAMWALRVCDQLNEQELLKMLRDNDPHVRAWAVRFLCEQPPSSLAIDELQKLAARSTDSSAVVRLELASALQRFEPNAAWNIATSLCQFQQDSNDHNLPKMIWFGVEPLVVNDPSRALQLATASKIPLVTRHIARRLTDAQKYEILVQMISAAKSNRRNLLLGMRDGLEGRYNIKAPDNWKSLYDLLKNDAEVGPLVVQLSQQFDNVVAAESMLATLDDRTASVEDRKAALRGLAGRKWPALRSRIGDLLNEQPLRIEAIRAMAGFEDVYLAQLVLSQYESWSAAEQQEVIHVLATRSKYGWELTKAIKNETVPRADVPAYVARLLQRVVGNGFLEVWGPVEVMSSKKESQFLKYRSLLTRARLANADLDAGHAVFKKTCQTCHKMYGQGGEIGPDITGANRTNLDYILGNVITPSAVIQDAYRMHLVFTFDGLTYSGIPVSEDERYLTLRIANREKPVTIAKSEIESREIAKFSMMPEGMLDNLSEEEVVNLVKYLQTTEADKKN